MSKFLGSRSATTVELTLLSLVFVCLPLFEAPKNVASALFLLVWAFYAIRRKGIGRSSPFDPLILGLAVILWIAPLFSDFGDYVTPMNSAPRWTLLALFVLAASRLDYSRKQLITVIVALMVGGVVAVADSFWMWSLNERTFPEFRSVGHVNHSSMYSLISLAAGIAAFYMPERWLKALGIATIVSTLAFLLPSKSLVGGAAILAVLIVGLSVWALSTWSFRRTVIVLCTMVICLAGALALPPAASFREELSSRVTGDDVFSQRDKILNSALAVWYRHPLIGTGWFSFGIATSENEVRAALAEDSIEYDSARYAHHSHGHNLWTTMLIERGLFGVGLVTALLLMYFWIFLPLALSREHLSPSDCGAVVMALLIAVGFAVAGLGNTTMMNEHGHSGMALIAVSYGYLRSRGLVGQNASA